MSRRNTYLIGVAAILVGSALIVLALVVLSDDGGGGGGSAAPTAPSREARQGTTGTTGAAGGSAAAGSLAKQVAERRTPRAPRFSLVLVQEGTPPAQVRGPLARAGRGGRLDIAALRGTPVVLHVWSSECAPCRADARLLQTTWERWGRRGVAFVGLSVDADAQDALRYARQYGLTYPVVNDSGARVARAYGVERLPETFFISAAGTVVGHVAGGPSVRQIEFGAAAARSGRSIGSEQGSGSVPLR